MLLLTVMLASQVFAPDINDIYWLLGRVVLTLCFGAFLIVCVQACWPEDRNP
jgi:hypothetical protein